MTQPTMQFMHLHVVNSCDITHVQCSNIAELTKSASEQHSSTVIPPPKQKVFYESLNVHTPSYVSTTIRTLANTPAATVIRLMGTLQVWPITSYYRLRS